MLDIKLACATALQIGLGVDRENVMFYDPSMMKEDVLLVTLSGWRVGQSEVDFSLDGDGALLLYMPHCDYVVDFQRVLVPIKTGEQLRRVVLFGNQLGPLVTINERTLKKWFIDLVRAPSTQVWRITSARTPLEIASTVKDLVVTTFANETSEDETQEEGNNVLN